MSDKSHVGMGVYRCPVCLEKTDEVLLFNTKLRNTLERENFVGFKMCEEHNKKLYEEEYVALIETSSPVAPTSLTDKYRTGNYALIKENVYNDLFNVPISKNRICFVQVGILQDLQKIPVIDEDDSNSVDDSTLVGDLNDCGDEDWVEIDE